MIGSYRAVRKDWRRNHRHHGGLKALGRCLLGTAAIHAGLAARRRTRVADIEMLTFSVVPWMTALWALLFRRATASQAPDILIGDCSGGFGKAQRGLLGGGERVLPCLNRHHGDKLDLFLTRVCRAPYVVVADDDVFWLDDESLGWALNRLEADQRVAVVSLKPRREVSGAMRHDQITEPMGSHCLVIRLELWLRERLSFAVAPPPAGVDDWFYDTGDLAHRELVRRGYRVAVAPPELDHSFVSFDGLSSWILKLQGHSPGRLAKTVEGIPVRQRKAVQALAFARGLAVLLGELGLTAPAPEIVPASRLDAAERALEEEISAEDRRAARRDVEQNLRRIRDHLFTLASRSGRTAPCSAIP